MNYAKDLSMIITSKEYRRMQDKTQLFYARKGDHYRTRLTHTQEVCDIALQIAANLRKQNPRLQLDNELIMAIAYGHDVGHTPFGHVGERVLSSIIDGTDDLGSLIKPSTLSGHCFKHNANSLRILTRQEFLTHQRKPLISWQVLDGVLKHTAVYKTSADYNHLPQENQDDPYQIKKIMSKGKLSGGSKSFRALKTKHKFNYYHHNFALTIEGQIVAKADEIAQRISDFDDAVRAGYWTPAPNAFRKISRLNFFVKNAGAIRSLYFKPAKNSAKSLCDNLRDCLIAEVKFTAKKRARFSGQNVYLDNCIEYLAGGDGETIDKLFEDINKKYIIQCQEIRKCDSSSKHIIRQLFKAFYKDINQIDDNCINQIIYDFRAKLQSVFNQRRSSKRDKLIYVMPIGKKQIQFRSNLSLENKRIFIKCIKQLANGNNPVNTISSKTAWRLALDELSRTSKGGLPSNVKWTKQAEIRRKLTVELHTIIVRNIAFYIAGMTDSFAREEYQRLYGIKMPIHSY